MAATRRDISLGFTPERLHEGLHVCYLFDDDEERLRVMAPFLQSGLDDREKVLYLVDQMTPAAMIRRLDGLGVDARSRDRGLVVSEAAPTYCPGGTFSGTEMLDVVRDFYLEALANGYAGARGTGEMSWCLVEGRTDLGELMDYEARLNVLLQAYPYTACCQYDVRRFDGQTIMDVLSVHPLMIVRGQVVRNPCFVEPATFLARTRRATPAHG